MLSNRSKFVSVLIAMMLVLSLTIPVFAQDEVEPVDEPVVEEPGDEEPDGEETSSKFLNHPIVKLFAEFFASFFNPPEEEEPAPDEGDGTDENGGEGVLPPDGGEDGGESGEPEDSGEGGEPEDDGEGCELEEPPIVPEEKIASMHGDDKLGFGVIAKLIGIVECAEGGVTLDDLVAQFKGGVGQGKLYEMYCKPENVGVGHIRKAVKELDQKEKTNNGKNKNK